MKFKLVLSFLVFIFSANTLFSQQAENFLDVVYLKNGSIFKGEIIEYVQGDFLRFQFNEETVIVFKEKDIKKILHRKVVKKQETAKKIKLPRTPKEYQFKEKGWYNATFLNTNIGGSAFNSTETNIGFGVSTVFGYKFNRLLGVGAGIGMDYYYLGSGSNFMPVFAEIRGYIYPKNISPVYSFAAGYGFAFDDEDRNISEANGGLMVHPAIGFRFGGSNTMNFTLDAGVKIQKGIFTYQNWDVVDEYRMTYKRLILRAGIVF